MPERVRKQSHTQEHPAHSGPEADCPRFGSSPQAASMSMCGPARSRSIIIPGIGGLPMYRHGVLVTAALLLLSSAGQVVAQQDPNLFGWWKLDEGQGTIVADSSGKGQNGTIHTPQGGGGRRGA